MRLILEAILSSTALWGDSIHLEEVAQDDEARQLTLNQLAYLQQLVGQLHQHSRSLLKEVKYDDQQ